MDTCPPVPLSCICNVVCNLQYELMLLFIFKNWCRFNVIAMLTNIMKKKKNTFMLHWISDSSLICISQICLLLSLPHNLIHSLAAFPQFMKCLCWCLVWKVPFPAKLKFRGLWALKSIVCLFWRFARACWLISLFFLNIYQTFPKLISL